MDNRILVVIQDRDMQDFVVEMLEDYFDGQDLNILIDKTGNVKYALKRTSQCAYKVIIVHLHIAEDRKAVLSEKKMLGLDLLQRLQDNEKPIPAILLTPIVNNAILNKAGALSHVSALIVGEEKWDEQIVERVRHAIDRHSASAVSNGASKKVNLDFIVDAKNKHWTMLATGVGDVICNPKPHVLNVNINRNKVDQREGRVVKLKNEYPEWEEQLQEIGENLVREIIDKNPETMDYYKSLKRKVGGSENFSIRFTMGEDAFSLPVEAILEPDFEKNNDFWMLKAPISRRFDVQPDEDMWPLFEGERRGAEHKKINCLIIEADVDGYFKDLDIELKKLENIAIEANKLKVFLRNNQEKYNIGKIEHLNRIDQSSMADHVKQVLTNGDRWDLVHYAGHSCHKETGYVFFPCDGAFKSVDIKLFGQWLRSAKTRMIYLSSCQSSRVQFVHKLAKIGVPSALGFRWDIDDRKAAEHAEIFYQKLFEERSLEYAFLKTRQQIHENNPRHIIWASPVLVMQARN